MKTILPTDCGNAPRITIVGEFVINWAKNDSEVMNTSLTDDVDWTIVGHGPVSGEGVSDRVCPEGTTSYLEVTLIITHGRLASCDGFLETNSSRICFSHVFRFASTSKAAKIKQARTYLVECPA